MNPPDQPARRRRSLTHVGGAIETAGDQAEARALAHALEVAPATDAEDDPARGHVHGFHTYPARMHPTTAARLVAAFVPPGGRVLDPFCGSGTVLVEALILNRHPLGVDLNPLAVLLAGCKTRPRPAEELAQLVDIACDIAAAADARRKAKAGASRRFPPEDLALFEPHVLLELDSLRHGIEQLSSPPARADQGLILSSLLVKYSKKRADTSQAQSPRRTAPGAAAKQFILRAEDLARRLGVLQQLRSRSSPVEAFVAQDDAIVLRTLPPGLVDAVITSPPYAGTYNYVEHHALRSRWLGLDATALERYELGSRSRYRSLTPPEAGAYWARELSQVLRASARHLKQGSPLVLLMGDSAVRSVALRADEIVAGIARECGFHPSARASQPRPHFHLPTMTVFATQPRREHAILLRRM